MLCRLFIINLDLNSKLLGIGCSSHIAHNAARIATEKMLFEEITLEDFALKVLSHFSGHPQRMDMFEWIAEEQGVINN